jgi:molybdopterin-dependent oxidoreductase alpha subunit
MEGDSHDEDPPLGNRADAQYWPKTYQWAQTEADRLEMLKTCEENAAGNPRLRKALPPEGKGKARIGHRSEAAAGIPAILKTMQYGLDEMSADHLLKTYLKINQKDGFDCQSCAWPNPDGKRFVAEFCENGAKAVASEATRRRVTPEFFQKWSVDELADQTDHWLNEQGRLTHPMVLRPGRRHYEPIDWSDAFSLIAGELNRLASPDEAAFYTSGRTSNEAAFIYQLFVRQFGTNNLPDCSNMCHESSGTGMVESLGVGKTTVMFGDFTKADLIFCIGQNPGTNHPRMLTTLEDAKRNGAKIIAINPLPEVGLIRVKNPNPQEYRNPLAYPAHLLGKGFKLADLFLQVRINGDVAVLKGIMKSILEEEDRRPGQVLDHEFIKQYTAGFDDFAADLRRTSWEEIVEESGVPKDRIGEAGQMMGNAKRMIGCWAMGLTQHKNGVDNIEAAINVLLLGGHMGRPGAGACCVRGHSNVQGDRTMGVWEQMPQAFLDALGREFNFTPPSKHGCDTVDTIKAMHHRAIKVFFAMGGNFLSATPDTCYTAEALRRCRLTAHVSIKLNRAHLITGEQALILPCLGRSEKDRQTAGEQFVTVEDALGVISSSRGVVEPASPHLLSEPAIVAGLAKATLGRRSTVDWDVLVADYDRIRDHISHVIPGFEDFNRRIRADIFYLPNAARNREFKTATGKANFIVHQIPHHDLKPGQLLMTTIRSHDQFNTTIYGLNDRYRGVYGGRHVIFLNRDDIQEAGLSAGQFVDIISHFKDEQRTACHFRVVPYEIPRRCAATYFPETNVLVSVQSVADKSKTPVYKSILISLRPSTQSATGPTPH